jgi:hypothetical protein
MLEQEIQGIVRLFEVMAEVEKGIGYFYADCAETFGSESELWTKLSHEEFLHADVLIKLSEMIIRKPDQFEVGQLLPMSAVRTILSRIHGDQQKLSSGSLTIYGALLIAYHFERTIIELDYLDIVKANNPRHIRALENLVQATTKHRDRIKKKLDQYSSGYNVRRMGPR